MFGVGVIDVLLRVCLSIRSTTSLALVRFRHGTDLPQCVLTFMNQNHVIGMTVAAIADDEETLIGMGRRDLASQLPPDGETVYEIGSISKTFTGLRMLL